MKGSPYNGRNLYTFDPIYIGAAMFAGAFVTLPMAYTY